MNAITIHTPAPDALTAPHEPITDGGIDGLISIILGKIAPSTRRSYSNTYRLWIAYCNERGIRPTAIRFEDVKAFIEAGQLSRKTRLLRLSHIRQLAKLIALDGDPNDNRHFRAINSFMRIKHNDNDTPPKPKRALTAHEVDAAISAYPSDTPRDIRNRAILHTLYATGIRRAELCDIRRSDVDLEKRIIIIQHGKGDKRRAVLIAREQAITAIAECLAAHESEWAFPALTRGRSPQWADKAMNAQNVYDLCRKSGFAPHTMRRTHITRGLENGATLADMQAQAGHANGATTLIYAQSAQASERRIRL